MKNKTIFSISMSLLASLLGIVLNFILAHYLEAEAYGKLQYMIALITTYSSFLIFGLDSFIIKEAKNPLHEKDILNKSISFLFTICIVGVPIVLVISSFLEKYDFGDIFFYVFIAVGVISLSINKIISSYYNGTRKLYASSLIELIVPKSILLVFVIVCILFFNKNVVNSYYLILYLIIYLFIAVLTLLFSYRKFDLKLKKKEYVTIVMLFGTTVTYSLTENVGKVLQGALFKDPTVLGIVSVSLSVISLVSVFTSIINSIAKPLYAQYNRENSTERLIDVYRFNTRANSYFFLPLYLFFILCAGKFLFLFGESYTSYPLILVILALRALASSITGPNGGMLTMTGHEKMQFVNGVVYLGTFSLFMWVFSYDHIYGLSLAFLTAEIIVNIMKYIEVWMVFKCLPLDLKTLLSFLFSIVIDGTFIYLTNFIKNIWLWLICGILIGVVLIVVNFVVSPYRKIDFKRLVKFESEK